MPGPAPKPPTGHVNIGDCAIATRPMLLTTVLGSCVSATFHHPGRRAGGMFHAMLPSKALRRSAATPDCTFADLAVEAMLNRFAENGMEPGELTVRIFGGANTMRDVHGQALRDMLDVGAKNVQAVLAALSAWGLRPASTDVLGSRGRKLEFNTASGTVLLSYLGPEEAPQ